MAITKVVAVTQYVKVTVDETKFGADFRAEFNSSIFDAGDALNEHFKHLAQLHARGFCDGTQFIEGYGPAADMGIKLETIDREVEIQADDPMTVEEG